MKDLSPGMTHSGDVTVGKELTFGVVSERVNIISTAFTSGVNAISCNGSQVVKHNTAAATANMTFNFIGDTGVSLDSVMSVGESRTIAILITNGSTAYKPVEVQVDGTAITPKWAGGSAPSAGNASSIDSYTYTIIKTASATFVVLASLTQYK